MLHVGCFFNYVDDGVMFVGSTVIGLEGAIHTFFYTGVPKGC